MRGQRRRLEQLLLARATSRLSPADQAELARLLAGNGGVDEEAYERAAAAICIAALDTGEPMPSGLRASLERQAAEFFSSAAPARR